ncbi:unnamed protein product [Closterium sp. NIES-65]|nr:unnamed protein product [Closterium sp. NIES-65]
MSLLPALCYQSHSHPLRSHPSPVCPAVPRRALPAASLRSSNPLIAPDRSSPLLQCTSSLAALRLTPPPTFPALCPAPRSTRPHLVSISSPTVFPPPSPTHATLPSGPAPATLLTLPIPPLSASLPSLPPLPLSPHSPTPSPLSLLSPLSVLSHLPSLPFFPPLPSPPSLPSLPHPTPVPALQPPTAAAAPSLTPAALRTPLGAGRCDAGGDAMPDVSSMCDVSLLHWRWRREGERVRDVWRGGRRRGERVVTREGERESGGADIDSFGDDGSSGDSDDCSASDGDSDSGDRAGSDGGAGGGSDWAGVLTAGKLLNPTQVITRIAPLLSRSPSFPLPPTAAAAAAAAAATAATYPAGTAGTPMPAGTAAATAAGAVDSIDSLEARCLALRLIGCLAPLAADVAHVQELVVRAAMEAEGQQEVSEGSRGRGRKRGIRGSRSSITLSLFTARVVSSAVSSHPKPHAALFAATLFHQRHAALFALTFLCDVSPPFALHTLPLLLSLALPASPPPPLPLSLTCHLHRSSHPRLPQQTKQPGVRGNADRSQAEADEHVAGRRQQQPPDDSPAALAPLHPYSFAHSLSPPHTLLPLAMHTPLVSSSSHMPRVSSPLARWKGGDEGEEGVRVRVAAVVVKCLAGHEERAVRRVAWQTRGHEDMNPKHEERAVKRAENRDGRGRRGVDGRG